MASDTRANREKIELDNLLAPPGGVAGDENGTTQEGEVRDGRESLALPSPATSYGSTMSIGPGASTANLLRIDLDKKISRHTGEERETWDSRAEFILSLIGYAVGLGNVWRFPYLTQKNGGGAFLIPYAIMLVIEGIPLFYLELAIGQRLRKGAVGAWNQVSPLLQGLGLASAGVSINLALYYNTIMAWCCIYLVQSFQSPLPWSVCPSTTEGNVTVINAECQKSGSTSYFWYRQTLDIAPSVESPSVINWKLALSLLVCWTIVYLCLIKGIKSSGKVVYVTATFPYLVLVIFFFRGITLRGFERGLWHLFVPEWKSLLDPKVWLDAATQIFYSFGLAFGCLIALSSYNPVRNNFAKQAYFVTICDFFTSIFTATVVFSILGFKATIAYEECLEKYGNGTDVITNGHSHVNHTCDFKTILVESGSGTGLAFIAFTEAINQFPVAQLWSILFFLMLFTLGLDSMFGTLEGALTSINDMMLFPGVRREIMCGVVCLISFVIALCFSTSTGSYVFYLFDSFSANIPLLIIAFIECVAVSHIYGLDQMSYDIEMMIGTRPNYFFLICWKYIGPLAMIVIFLASIVEMFSTGLSYDIWDAGKGFTVTVPLPWWCLLVAFLLVMSSVLWIPLVAIVKYFHIIDWKPEVPAFFPEEELVEEKNIKPHVTTNFEKHVLGFKQ
ncbi:sodium-dependent neutral amino acid transporter B(0)AT3-like [Pecten maximus]|uniref:sodium-dependent neutral amino acid transporter B(0)AT3-like n=1 Tax=Pecten maximus TaxID=6579 RepID=UPI001458FA24|nr:sodium-dependent neutral amino acid transporter B(0)AT3-like [Pecten maximus]